MKNPSLIIEAAFNVPLKEYLLLHHRALLNASFEGYIFTQSFLSACNMSEFIMPR
jgi:hypothetical protein